MTIYAPLQPLNPFPISKCAFQLTPVQEVTPTGQGAGGGFTQTIDRATPVWTFKADTAPLEPVRYAAFIGWLDQLEGSAYPFLFSHPRYAVPQAYTSVPGITTTTTPPWGSLTDAISSSFSDNNFQLGVIPQGTVRVSGVLPGMISTPGDYISYRNGYTSYLYRIVSSFVEAASQPNQAWSLTDSSGAVSSYLTQQVGGQPNNRDFTNFVLLLGRTAGGTSKTVVVQVGYTGGSNVFNTLYINTDTGTELSGAANFAIAAYDTNWWKVTCLLNNNASGNTTVAITVYPAYAPHGSTANDVTLTGTCTLWHPRGQNNGRVITSKPDDLSNGVWTLAAGGSVTKNVTGPGQIVSYAVRPRPLDALTMDQSCSVSFLKASGAFKLVGQPQWSDSVEGLPVCTFMGAQYLERGTP